MKTYIRQTKGKGYILSVYRGARLARRFSVMESAKTSYQAAAQTMGLIADFVRGDDTVIVPDYITKQYGGDALVKALDKRGVNYQIIK